MAHADYECCAICDRKQTYCPDVEAKTVICTHCAVELAIRGVIAHNLDELRDWLMREDPERLRRVLQELNYLQCLYPSEIDEIVTRRLNDPSFGALSFLAR